MREKGERGREEGDLQRTQRKYRHERSLLIPPHLQRANDGNRQDQDEDIERGVPSGVGVPKRRGAKAVAALDGLVPVELDGGALEGGGEGEGDHGGDDGPVCDNANGAKAWVASEDVEVEVEEGHLGQRDENLVEDLVDIEVLGRIRGGKCRGGREITMEDFWT